MTVPYERQELVTVAGSVIAGRRCGSWWYIMHVGVNLTVMFRPLYYFDIEHLEIPRDVGVYA